MKLLVIISAYNESEVIGEVIQSTKKECDNADVLVIDDGSSDSTLEVAKRSGALVVRHVINRGLGGAIGTGLMYAKIHGYKLAVTIDADGQHDPRDIKAILDPIKVGDADVVIGSRMISQSVSEMPLDRRLINSIANFVTYMFFGIRTTDSQSGFRGFGENAIQQVTLRTERMEASTEVFSEIKRLGLNVCEVPIRVIYTDYSMQKGQSNSNGLVVLYKLLIRLFRT